jgi:hypothetical protein
MSLSLSLNIGSARKKLLSLGLTVNASPGVQQQVSRKGERSQWQGISLPLTELTAPNLDPNSKKKEKMCREGDMHVKYMHTIKNTNAILSFKSHNQRITNVIASVWFHIHFGSQHYQQSSAFTVAKKPAQ